MEKKQTALKVLQLTVNYDKTPVLWDISLEIPTGQLVGIIGPNGAGKSTLIKAVLGLIHTISGKVEFFGLPLKKVRSRVAYVPQRESVDWDFPITVRDLVLMGRYGRLGMFHWPRQADWAAADHYLNMVDMYPFKNRQISQLSGGQQQRVFIARALLQEADLYFMDEPFAGIDATSEAVIMNILRQLKAENKTVCVVHHDLQAVEDYFDWAIMLNMRLIASGKVTQVFNADTLSATYGKGYHILDEAFKLAQQKTTGML